MARLTFMVLAVAMLVLCAHADDECGPNGVYKSCGSYCPATCRNPNPRGLCPSACRSGCQCTGGTVLNDNGSCIPRSECPRQG